MPKRSIAVAEMSRKDLAAHSPASLDYPCVGYMAKRGERLVACGGLAWRWERCDIWLDVVPRRKVPAVAVVRWARRMIRMAVQMGETEVFCFREELPTSRKLLELVGFSPLGMQTVTLVDGTQVEKEVWRWQASRQSQP